MTSNFGGGRSITTYTSSILNAIAERKTFMGANGTPFSWIIVQYNGTKFAWSDFFPNIQPFPCFASFATFFQWPNFSKAGNLQVANQLYDLYFGTDHRLWVFQNNSIPISALDPDYPMTEFVGFSPNPPDPALFKLPSMCFVPPSNNKRSVEEINALPVFPNTYTMYVTYYDTFAETSGKLNIFYDGIKGYIRVDTPYITYIQKNNVLYSFINAQLNKVAPVSPLPCYTQVNRSYTIWANPSFEKFLGNVTVSGKIAKVLLDGRLDSTVISFWYLSSPDNTPLYFVATGVFNVVDFFQALPPPPGVFDVPSPCVMLNSTQKRFNLYESPRRK